jgi:hypothetical protein
LTNPLDTENEREIVAGADRGHEHRLPPVERRPIGVVVV